MSEPFIAEIKMFGGNFAPRGYASCNGQTLAINQNSALYSLLGTAFGGNGTTTFALPNFQGRSPVHYGTGPGLPPVKLGQTLGQPSVTLALTQLPPHTHQVTGQMQVVSGAGTSRTPSGGYLAGDAGGDANYAPGTATPDGTLAAGAITAQALPAGGGQPISTQSPALAVNFIIALQGTFPGRN